MNMNAKNEIQRRSFKRIVLACSLFLFLIWAGAFVYRASFIAIDGRRYFSLFDDAMISMRYAWNLAHGNGLVWNLGERVEGYTNLLMVLVMAVPNLVLEKRLAALAIQLFGVINMIGIAYLAKQIAVLTSNGQNGKSIDLLEVLVFGGTLGYYPLVFWSLMGMETGLLALLSLLAVRACILFSKTTKLGYLIQAATAFGLAFLVRPDSFILSLVIIGFTVTVPPFEQKILKLAANRILILVGGMSLFVLGQLLFRFAYYHELFPNTYILKLEGMPLMIRLTDGFRFLTPFFGSMLPSSVLIAAGLIARPKRWMFMFVSVATTLLGYQIWTGGDPWPYWRILAPAFPLLLIVLVHGCIYLSSNQIWKRMRGVPIRAAFIIFGLYFLTWPFITSNPRLSTGIGAADLVLIGIGTAAIFAGILHQKLLGIISHSRLNLQAIVLTGLALISLNLSFLPEMVFKVRPYTVQENIEMVNRAIAISEVTTSNASVGVIYAGAIPYYTGLPAIDFLGKSDKYVARLAPDITGSTGWYGMRSVPGHNKYDLYYSIVSLTPTYIQGTSWGRQDIMEWAKTAYVTVEHRGVLLTLKRDDPNVLWEKIRSDK